MYNSHFFILQVDCADELPGFDLFFVTVYKDNHVIGGTTSGMNFATKIASYIPHTFVGYLSSLYGKTILYRSYIKSVFKVKPLTHWKKLNQRLKVLARGNYV